MKHQVGSLATTAAGKFIGPKGAELGNKLGGSVTGWLGNAAQGKLTKFGVNKLLNAIWPSSGSNPNGVAYGTPSNPPTGWGYGEPFGFGNEVQGGYEYGGISDLVSPDTGFGYGSPFGFGNEVMGGYEYGGGMPDYSGYTGFGPEGYSERGWGAGESVPGAFDDYTGEGLGAGGNSTYSSWMPGETVEETNGYAGGNINEKDTGGGLFDSWCIIVTACHGRYSPEVDLTRWYRDTFMNSVDLRGYYRLADKIVPLMKKSAVVTGFIKSHLVDHLISYGRAIKHDTNYRIKDMVISKAFLGMCRIIGRISKKYTRSNGEVY
jgi:hypothetical protein